MDFDGLLSFTLSFFFPDCLHCCYIDCCCYIDFHCSYSYYNSLEPCPLNAEFQHFVLSFSISYWDLIKFPYFTDTTKRAVRGWKEAQRQGEDKVTLRISLIYQIFDIKVPNLLVWTPCLMHRCVCIWWYILQNYNYKLHFQNLSIYHIPQLQTTFPKPLYIPHSTGTPGRWKSWCLHCLWPMR